MRVAALLRGSRLAARSPDQCLLRDKGKESGQSCTYALDEACDSYVPVLARLPCLLWSQVSMGRR